MIVGIDLGTTYSTIAQVNEHGVPTLFSDFHDSNEFRTPSVFHLGTDGCLIGRVVEDLLEDEPELSVARFFKLAMGKGTPVYKDQRGREWSPEAVSACLLKKLVKDAIAFTSDEVEGAVISVPSHFGDAERRATRDAARIAGLHVPALVEEPVAAATYYGLDNGDKESLFFVYDMGGGTFDATLLRTGPEGMFVLATEGAEGLGGKAVDDAIMGLVARDFELLHRVDLMNDKGASAQLRRLAEQVKLKLSKPGLSQVRQTVLLAGRTYDLALTRSQFDDLISPIVENTIEVSRRCIDSAGVSWAQVDRLLLAGGSTMIPRVHDRVLESSGLARDAMIRKQPHQAIGYGAAIVASHLRSGAKASQVVQQIASYNLGIRVMDRESGRPSIQQLIRRNSPLPARHAMTLYTTRNDQQRMIIELIQSRNDGDEGRSLGHFSFGPMADVPKNHPIELTVGYDADGVVAVTAKDPKSGRKIEKIMEEDSSSTLDSSLKDWREIVANLRINE